MTPASSTASPLRRGSRPRTPGSRPRCAPNSPSSSPRGAGSSRPATRSGGVSSCASAKGRCDGSRLLPQSLARARRAAGPTSGERLDQARSQLGRALADLHELALGLHPRELVEDGLEGAAGRSRRPESCARRARRRAGACRAGGRGGGLLPVLGGAHERREVRVGLTGRDPDRRDRRSASRSRSPTTASAVPIRREARACAGSKTGSRRSAAPCASRAARERTRLEAASRSRGSEAPT